MVFFTRLLCIYFFLTSLASQAQQRDVITVQRNSHFLYFYQQGQPCDTISFNKHDLFCMNVSEARKCGLIIETENGYLSAFTGDTLFRLRPVRHINYLQYFTDNSEWIVGSRVRNCNTYQVATNGTNTVPDPRHIVIRFYSGAKDSLLFTNHFYYK